MVLTEGGREEKTWWIEKLLLIRISIRASLVGWWVDSEAH